MAIDQVAVSREKLRLANEGGSLSNEQKFRKDLEEFQHRGADRRPEILKVSSPAEDIFQADITKLKFLERETTNHEFRQVAQILIRALEYLGHRVE
jgi:hypothetical protein